jgi:thiosulfate reductase cytochrome b subunit
MGGKAIPSFPSFLCYPPLVPAQSLAPIPDSPRHSALVRVTHWLTVIAFLALLVTGVEIVISHPRFYWGETGNSGTTPLFSLHIPASRDTVPTGYNFGLPDQNGWSRYLHFQAAWLAVLTGLIYAIYGIISGHFRRHLFPAPADRNWRAVWRIMTKYLRRAPPSDVASYNVLQQVAYLSVIFVLFPLIIWTGLALSPAFDSAFPATVNLLGGRQSARTLHFFDSIALLLFVIVHVVMVSIGGFKARMRAMITGSESTRADQAARSIPANASAATINRADSIQEGA